jgi:hypothetical protein
MDFLVLSPPVIPPSEPPSGAFLLAAGLTGRGFSVGLLDLSIEFFHSALSDLPSSPKGALQYLLNTPGGYTPDAHRSAAGRIHAATSAFGDKYPGWKLTMMDLTPPWRVHHPSALANLLDREQSPFRMLFESCLEPILETRRPKQVLISLAYLSQLPAAVALHLFLLEKGHRPIVGGSLPNSLHATGHGLHALKAVFPQISIGDGSSLLGPKASGRMLDSLAWPEMLSERQYLSARPIIPLALSSGCYWNRCLFCPDRDMPYFSLCLKTISDFMKTVPQDVARRGPVIHFLDSALPPKSLRAFLPIAASHNLGFFGFARPTAHLTKDNLLEDAAAAGCLMLQLGAEGGSGPLLDRFQKGICPDESKAVITRAAAAGIRTYLYLLFGLPGESLSDLQMTRHWAAQTGPCIDFLNLSLFNLPRYCELTDKAEEFGIRISDYPHDPEGDGIRLYRPFLCNGVDPKDQARRFLKELKAMPSLRKARLQTPRWFRAAHLALMKIDGRALPHPVKSDNKIQNSQETES